LLTVVFWRMIAVRKDVRSNGAASQSHLGVVLNQRNLSMFRLRLTTVALAAGLGLVCGCNSCREFSLFRNRTCAESVSDCCVVPSAGCAGSVGGDGGPGLEMPLMPAPAMTPVPAPQNTMPQLAPAPRLVPQPQQSQPMPYSP
jgi:hypothetical protein